MMLDVFNNNKFALANLTARVNELPFVPGLLGNLGIFSEEGVYAPTIAVENAQGTLVLIPNSERGSSPTPMSRDARKLRDFRIPRKATSDHIKADEIQSVRAFGEEDELETAQNVLDRRAMKMSKAHDATVEYGRIGAVKGVIYDADGSTVIYNLFTEFGIAQSTVDFVLGTAGTDVLAKSVEVREKIQDALGGDGNNNTRVMVVCGKTWFKNFVGHAKVAEAYKYYQTVQQSLNPLQRDLRYTGFTFGDVTYVVYRGAVGSVNFVAANEAHAFPLDIPDLFITRFAPADYMETVNTEGLPRYSKIVPGDKFNRSVEMEMQSNPLSLCTRPASLIKLTTSN